MSDQTTGQQATANPDASPLGDVDDFAVFLAKRAPKVVRELTELLAQVTAAVKETGKKGSLTYTLVLEPASKDGPDDMLKIGDQVKAVVPKPKREPLAVMWAGKDGQLLDHPGAQTMLDVTGRRK